MPRTLTTPRVRDYFTVLHFETRSRYYPPRVLINDPQKKRLSFDLCSKLSERAHECSPRRTFQELLQTHLHGFRNKELRPIKRNQRHAYSRREERRKMVNISQHLEIKILTPRILFFNSCLPVFQEEEEVIQKVEDSIHFQREFLSTSFVGLLPFLSCFHS